MLVTLTVEEVSLVIEALDSHRYWQLSDPVYRNDGDVQDPGSEDEDAAAQILKAQELEMRLISRLAAEVSNG